MPSGLKRPGFSTRNSLVAIVATVLAWCLPAAAGCGHHQVPREGITAMSAMAPIGVLGMQPSEAQANDANGSASIVGFWHVLFTSGGQPFDEGYDVWHSDGTEILNDNAPPAPANGGGNFCMGVYEKTGPGAFKLKHPFWLMDANGNYYAYGRSPGTGGFGQGREQLFRHFQRGLVGPCWKCDLPGDWHARSPAHDR